MTKKELIQLTKGSTFVSESLNEVLTFNYKTQSYYETNQLDNEYTYNFSSFINSRTQLVFLSTEEIQDYLYNYEFTQLKQ